jgi:hypothetical protein
MNRKVALIIILQAMVIVVMAWLLVFYGKDEYEAMTAGGEEEIETASHVVAAKEGDHGAATIMLTPASQQQAGLRTSKLQSASHQAAVSSFGAVVGIETLVELRTRYLAALAEVTVVRAAIANSQQDYQRLQLLNKDNRNVSDRAVQAAEAAWKSDQARLVAAETLAVGIRDNMRQRWGETLAAWATQSSANESFQRLLQYRDVLLQVTLPFDTATPDSHSSLVVEPVGAQGQASKAQFISNSPQTDATVQGKTFFFRASADNLRAGMRVTARLTEQGKASAGVIVPDTAVVWYADKAWVYRKQGVDKFVRIQINTDVEANNEANNGWFNATGVGVGDEVVTSGAQLLLSEEFKYQIKNENED